jgi:hypothetical protein
MLNDKMTKSHLNYLTSFLLFIVCHVITTEIVEAASKYQASVQQNPSDKQLLLNGRIWRNQYSKAFGDQFFLTNTFLKGSVTFNGLRFDNLDLMYDIASDELILSTKLYPTILMNKEMVDSFCIDYGNRSYRMINAGTDTAGVLKGYVNVLYEGSSIMYVKYLKKIQPLAVDGRYDLFYQENQIYLKRGTEIVTVNGEKKFLYLLQDKKKEVRDFIRRNRIKISRKDPGTFIPVLKFYDSIINQDKRQK